MKEKKMEMMEMIIRNGVPVMEVIRNGGKLIWEPCIN